MRKTVIKWVALAVSLIVVIALITSVLLLSGNNSSSDDNSDDSNLSMSETSSGENSASSATSEESDMEVIAKPQLNIPENVFGEVPYVGLYEAETLESIYEESAEALLYPASMTKIVTASVALKYVSPDDIAKVGSEQDLVNWDSSKCGIVKGQKLTIRQLLYGLMLPSGNDAAYTIAVHVARTVSNNPDMEDTEAVKCFAELMNDFCAEIGANNSHFVNPEGWHAEDHFTTVRDLAIITQYAMTIPLICDIVVTPKYEFVAESGEAMVFLNSNPFVNPQSKNYSEYVTGMKTGSTNAAGKCLVTTMKIGENEYIAVVAGCATNEVRNETTNALIGYAVEYNNLRVLPEIDREISNSARSVTFINMMALCCWNIKNKKIA